jgi:lysophospholipase L1-like esterase
MFSFGQASPFKTEDYPFVKSAFNQFEFYGNNDFFNRFFEKMERVLLEENGQLNIVHFGGSHVQADAWSNEVRMNLNAVAPGVSGARGLIFPYELAKSNNPPAYKTEFTGTWEGCRNAVRTKECLLGVSGMSATTFDTISTIKTSFRANNPSSYAYTKLKIFHHLSDSSFDIFPVNDTVYTVKIDQKAGFTEFTFNERKTEIHLEFRKTKENQNYFTLFGLLPENTQPGIIYHSIGVNGASVPSYNKCQLFSQHLSVLKPDLVIFSIGINDTHDSGYTDKWYEANYDSLIAKVRAVAPNAAILFTTNTDSYINKKVPNKNTMDARKVMIKLAEKHGGAVYDIFNIMGGLTSIKNWEQRGMAKRDLVHLTADGYKVLGNLMFNGFLKSYIQFRSGNS